MKKIKWQQLFVFICLALVISTVGGLFLGFYRVDAAVSSLHITFGSGGNWTNYFTAYNDVSKTDEGTASTEFKSAADASGSFDPQIRLYKGVDYTLASDHIVQMRLRIEAKNGMTENPTSIKLYFGSNSSGTDLNETNIVQLKTVDWTNVGTDDNANIQLVEAVIPSTVAISSIKSIRLDMPDQGTYTDCTIRLWDLYLGPRSSAPIKTVSYKYKTNANAWYTRTELVYKGNKPKNIPTPLPTAVSGTTAYDATEKWLNSSGNVVDVANTAVTADVTYTAQYTTQYQVSFKYRNATNDAWTTESVWINSGSTPGNNVPTPPAYPQKTGTTHTRERFLGTWGGVATATVKTTKITAAVTFTADYVTQWRIQYSNYRESYDGGQVTTEEWVDNGQQPTKYKGKDTFVRNSVGNTQHIIVKIVRETTVDGQTNKVEYTSNFDEAYNFAADRNAVYRYTYNVQYLVRYFKSDNTTQLGDSKWVTTTKKPTYKPTANTVSGKTFVAWLQGKNGTAVEPTATVINAPTDFYPRYLDNAFVGSNSDSIVVNRTVTLMDGTTKDTHQYTIRMDVYNYGKTLDGYMKIMDNLKEDFAVITDVKVIRVPYLGNGKFKDDNMTNTQLREAASEKDANGTSIDTDGIITLGNGGSHAYVNDLKINEKKTGATVWLEAEHKDGQENIDHHYYTMHLYEEGYADNYGEAVNKEGAANRVVKNSEAYKNNAYLREVSNKDEKIPYGYKLVMIFDIELERDGTIGGNNLPLSHATEHAMVEYYSTLSEKENPTRTFYLSDVCTTEYFDEETNKTVTSNAWPNANVEILYDFCPHDYYMDLYDVEKTYFISGGKMEESSSFVQPGIITVLRRQAEGNNADNNYIIYGGMFTHGNAPVYVRKEADENAYNLYGLPNTDCNGVRNEKVRITYSVKHNGTGEIVYQTVCEPYSSSFRAITTSDPEGVDGKHNEIEVDFLQDHSVTITATVTPVHESHVDSFGRGTLATTWTKTAQSYYFAPRIAVVDTSNNIGIPLQDEVADADNFIAAPSVMYALHEDGGYRTVASARVSDIANPAIMEEDEIRWCFRKDTANGYTYEMASQDAQVLQGIQTITYTTQAINTPKRFTATDTMENRDQVVRHAYFIPSTCITYDQNALSFDTPANWILDGKVSQAFQYYDLYKGMNGTDRYGFDGSWHKELRTSEGELADRRGNGKDYNGGTLYTNVGATDTNPRNEWGIFTFTGTGFDLYSRNGPETGVIVAQVYDGALTIDELTNDKLVQNIFADTYLPETTYYQVPSVQWRATDDAGNLTHGTYTVRFRAYYHEAFDHQLYTKSAASKAVMTEEKICDIMGWDDSVPCTVSLSDAAYPALTRAANSDIEPGDYDVYIDGIRVYNTLGTNLQQASGNVFSTNANAMQYAAYAIYNRDNEVNAKYFNVNELLVDAEQQPSWEAGEADGVFYIAATDKTTESYEEYPGMCLSMSGKLDTEDVAYTSNGKTYYKKYLLHADSSKVMHLKHNTAIYLDTKDNKYYCLDSNNNAVVVSNHEVSLAFGNDVRYYSDKYDAIGPEFEIYLAEGNGVAFNVCNADDLSSLKAVHISLRCAYTDIKNQAAPLVEVYNGTDKKWVPISTSYGADHHELYYDVTTYAKSNGGNVYIRNRLNDDGKICYLSVMNVKLIGGKAPSVNTRMLIEAMDLIRGEAETPVLDEGLDLKHSLNLASDISINYVVPATSMEDVQSSYLMVEVPQYQGNELIGTETVRINPTLRGSMYYYILEDLSAIHMNDELKATLHVIKYGEHFISAEDCYSIAAYAYTQLNKDSSSEALKSLCANLLRYGSAAQTFKGYRTDFLADEELSQDHQAYLTDLETVSFSTTNVVLKDLESPSVLWKGKSLALNSKVSVIFLIDPTNYEGDAESLSLRVTYLNSNGEEEIVVLTESKLYSDKYPYRAFEFDGLLAAELRTVLSAAVYDGDTQVSATAQYAADAYGNGKTGDLLLVCKALFAYSDAAKAFFTAD